MALLNLKTFLKSCKKLLLYYNHERYHLFTNGSIVYGIVKGTRTERPDMYLNELFSKVTRNILSDHTGALESVIYAYEMGERVPVVDYEQKTDTTIAKTSIQEDSIDVIIANEYKKCCKFKPAGGKQSFVTDFKNKNVILKGYFETSLLDDEFIFILPVVKK